MLTRSRPCMHRVGVARQSVKRAGIPARFFRGLTHKKVEIPEAKILHNGVISSRPAKEPQEIPVPIIIKCCCGILCRLGYKTILDQDKEA